MTERRCALAAFALAIVSCQTLLDMEDTPITTPGDVAGGTSMQGGAPTTGSGATAGDATQSGASSAGGGAGTGSSGGQVTGGEQGGAGGEPSSPEQALGGEGGDKDGMAGAVGEGGAGGDGSDDWSSRVPVLNVAWDGTIIKVCFVDRDGGDGDASQRAAFRRRARALIESTWGRVSALDLFGFGNCGEEDGRGTISIGLSSQYPNGAGSEDPSIRARSVTLRLGGTSDADILYWFGRGLGFGHEYGRVRQSGSCLPCSASSPCEEETSVCLAHGYCGNASNPPSVMAAPGCGGAIEATRQFSAWDVMAARRAFGGRHSGAIVELGGRCLEVNGATNATGAMLDTWTCTGRYENNTWYPTQAPLAGSLHAFIAGYHRCAEQAGSSSSDAALVSQVCDATRPAQRWGFETVELRTLGEMCVAATVAEAGARLNVGPCLASTLNRWSLDDERIRLVGTQLCLTTPTPTVRGAFPELSDCSETDAQRFRLEDGGIEPAGLPENHLCLNVFNNDPTPGAAIGLWNACGLWIENTLFHARGAIVGADGCIEVLGEPADQARKVGVTPCVAEDATQQWDWYW